MSITDEQYKIFSDRSYWLDPNDKKKYDSTYKEGATKVIEGYEFQILKIQENSQTDGMQAMVIVS